MIYGYNPIYIYITVTHTYNYTLTMSLYYTCINAYFCIHPIGLDLYKRLEPNMSQNDPEWPRTRSLVEERTPGLQKTIHDIDQTLKTLRDSKRESSLSLHTSSICSREYLAPGCFV